VALKDGKTTVYAAISGGVAGALFRTVERVWKRLGSRRVVGSAGRFRGLALSVYYQPWAQQLRRVTRTGRGPSYDRMNG